MTRGRRVAAVTALALRTPEQVSAGDDTARLLLQVEAEDGQRGMGVGPRTDPSAWLAALRLIETLVVGEDATEMGRIDERITRAASDGLDVPLMQAARGALGTALHDLTGHLLGVAAYDLLGGRFHESVPAIQTLPALGPDTDARSTLDAAGTALDAGFRRFRLVIDRSFLLVDRAQMASAIDSVAAVRRFIGDGQFLVAVRGSMDVSAVIAFARGLERRGVDGLQIEGLGRDGVRALRRAVRLSIAIGPVPTLARLLPYLETHATDRVMIDDASVGPAAARQQADLAYHFEHMVIHDGGDVAIGLLVALHLAVAMPATELVGISPAAWQEAAEVLDQPVRFDAGAMRPPDGPGLGASVRSDRLERLNG